MSQSLSDRLCINEIARLWKGGARSLIAGIGSSAALAAVTLLLILLLM